MKIIKVTSIAIAFIVFQGNAQVNSGQVNGDNRPVSTAVPFLNINPDPRGGGMGDAGVATSSTTNDMYWNIGKLAFNEKSIGAVLTLNPWLRNIVSDMYLSNVGIHYKRKKEEAFGFNMTYFDLGKIEFRDIQNVSQGTFNPREYAFSGAYSRKLSQNFGLGLALKYIHSNLTGGYAGTDARPLNSAAVDLGVFYTKPITVKTSNDVLSFGANISNIGGKVKYVNSSSNTKKDFLPTNFRLGGAYTHEIDLHNKITFALDFNKLMTPSLVEKSTKSKTNTDSIYYVYPDKGLFSGMFGSFADSPGGFKEEIQEVTQSIGIEYNYSNVFLARTGYFNESKYKGGRKYISFGFGLRYNDMGFDFAYLVSQGKNNALGNTLRFLVSYNVDKKAKEPTSDSIQEQ